MIGGEVRELTLEEVQSCELQMLEWFDGVCAARGLRYSLCAGSLLGAVRHRGPIPWDDDIDVFMPRPDFDELIKSSGDLSADSRYLVTGNGIGMMRPLGRVLDTHTVVEQSFASEEATGASLWIDIFPVDGVPDDDGERMRLYRRARMLKALIGAYDAKPFTGRTRAKALLKTFVLKPVSKLVGIERLLDRSQGLVDVCPYESANLVGSLVWCTYGERECLMKDEFEDLIRMPFGEGEAFCTAAWDKYLHNVYGDYMTLPDEADRVPEHAVRVWQRATAH